MKKIVRVGTRDSRLAVMQTEIVIDIINRKHPEITFEIIKMKTKGDMISETNVDLLGDKGYFVNDIELALLEQKIDIAVHSMKDMPSVIPKGLYIAAVSVREDPRDVLVTRNGEKLIELKKGAIVGTSSLRRQMQILDKRPDLNVRPVRGNVITRLNKLYNNEYDALILAAAGLKRLRLNDKCSEYFEIDEFIPAIGQGILCIEAMCDSDVGYLKDSIHSNDSEIILKAERAFMTKLNGGCSAPIAAYAEITDEKIIIYGMYIFGSKIVKTKVEGRKTDATKLGESLAEMILALK